MYLEYGFATISPTYSKANRNRMASTSRNTRVKVSRKRIAIKFPGMEGLMFPGTEDTEGPRFQEQKS
jgi:hypothetical protein